MSSRSSSVSPQPLRDLQSSDDAGNVREAQFGITKYGVNALPSACRGTLLYVMLTDACDVSPAHNVSAWCDVYLRFD